MKHKWKSNSSFVHVNVSNKNKKNMVFLEKQMVVLQPTKEQNDILESKVDKLDFSTGQLSEDRNV